MTRTVRRPAALAGLLAVLLAAACTERPMPGEAAPGSGTGAGSGTGSGSGGGAGTGTGGAEGPQPLTAREMQVLAASNAFGLELFRHVSALADGDNVLLSPLSVSMALAMMLNGASGSTFTDMARTLGFEGVPEAEINEAYGGLLSKLRGRDPKVQFHLANSLWHERSFPIQQPFVDALRDHFKARVTALDFRDPAAPRAINDWVSQATNGRIKDLIGRIDPLEVLILVNAIYFKGPWATPFDPDATSSQPFTRADGSVVQVPTMVADGSYASYEADGVQAVELPYADGVYGMVLVAPAPGRSLDDVIARLSPESWRRWTSGLKRGRLMLYVPKFRFEFGYPLNRPLQDMGMAVAFDADRADFSRINPQEEELHISRVVHKTYIDVHELGTEAAGATTVVAGTTSAPPVMRFDRPFLVAIRERESGTLLFIGRVGDPRA